MMLIPGGARTWTVWFLGGRERMVVSCLEVSDEASVRRTFILEVEV